MHNKRDFNMLLVILSVIITVEMGLVLYFISQEVYTIFPCSIINITNVKCNIKPGVSDKFIYTADVYAQSLSSIFTAYAKCTDSDYCKLCSLYFDNNTSLSCYKYITGIVIQNEANNQGLSIIILCGIIGLICIALLLYIIYIRFYTSYAYRSYQYKDYQEI